MKVDLHVHSYVSDGRLSPSAVVEAAVAGGIDLLALTDHDTSAGVPEAREAAAQMGLALISGIEVSTRHGSYEHHVLGYGIDPASPAMLAHEEASVRRREDRVRAMLERLEDLGAGVSFEEVREAAGPEARSLGRPHVARALLAAGKIRYFGEAFDRYLADGGPAFVAQDFPSVENAIAMIHAAGGVAVWAHPPLDIYAEQIDGMVGLGLDGVECYRPLHTPAETQLLEGYAREHGLLVTGGSDWHGPHRGPLGEFYIRPQDIEEFLSRVVP